MTTPAGPQLLADATAIDQLSAPTSPLTSHPSTLVSPSPSPINPSAPSPHIEDDNGHDPMSEGDDVFDSSDGTERIPLPKRRYRSRQQKLNMFVNYLRQSGWTFEEFILAWAGFDGDQDIRLNHRIYHKQTRRRVALMDAMRTLSTVGVCQEQATLDLCIPELTKLTTISPFNKFDVSMNIEHLDYANAVRIIQAEAPVWYKIIRGVLSNTRANRSDYGGSDKKGAIDRRVFTVTSMVCFSRARKTSNTLASCLDLYLLGSGVQRRVIETLGGLGLCHSYVHANELMNKLSDHAKSQLKLRAGDGQSIVVYDNINFMDRRRDEEAGHAAVYRAMTNATLVTCQDLPATGLTQSMHDPKQPLRLKDIVLSPGVTGADGIGVQISKSLIADAIKRIHSNAVAVVFRGDNKGQYPSFPVVERLPAIKTQYYQFAGISADEGTIEGTYRVHDNIFLDQLGLHASDTPGQADDFSERLFLVHGDQLTAHRIRAVQREQELASLTYDRRRWIHAVPAWFHVQMNLLNTIVRTHWAPPLRRQNDIHSVSGDATRWGRSQISRDNAKYHLLEPIVAQGFTARVAALFYAAMRRRGLLEVGKDKVGRLEDITDAIGQLSAAQFLQLLEDVRTTAFTYTAWSSSAPDVDFRTMCRFLQESELFLTIRYAVKYGDIGILRRMVDPLIVVFFGAAQHNYGREMLYYRWNLSAANSAVLQKAILASGLVNWLGRESTFKPIDLALEHLNCSCKLDFRNYKNSTHDIDIIFQRAALCSSTIHILREKLEGSFGEAMSHAHTSAAAIPDMFLLAWTLLVNNNAEPRDSEQLRSLHMFDSCDIFQIGMDVLEERVKQFNSQHVRQFNGDEGSHLVAEQDQDDGFFNIHDYALSLHDGYDAVTDPAFDPNREPAVA